MVCISSSEATEFKLENCCVPKSCLLEFSYFDSLLGICYFVASVHVF